jgi:predicted acetyltransferase
MIRKAGRDDIRELSGLWARAFPGERTVEQRIAHMESGGVFGGIETTWIAEQAGRTVGAFRAFALTQHMHGTVYPMMGLAAVAVDETARRRGIGRQLCSHAVHAARERGDVLSVLYPFRPLFYETLGWGMSGELHIYRFRPESLRHQACAEVRHGTADDTQRIAECYERVAERTNGMLRRSPRVWSHHLDAEGIHVFVTGDDCISGYVLARFGRTTTPDEKTLYIRELVADDSRTYDALLGWISAQRDSCRIIHYEAAPDELLMHRLVEPRPPGFHNTRNLWAPVCRVIRGPMLRLLDLPAALEQRVRWAPSAPLLFGLQVIDDVVESNHGNFVIEFNGSRVSVARGHATPLLRLPISVLAQIFAGELRVMDAIALGRAECDGDATTMDTLFRTDRCFRLLDEF